MNQIARLVPDWLQSRAPQEWYERYGVRFELSRMPKTESERKQLALQIGRDGYELLSWLDVSQTPPDLSGEPAVAVLWRVWLQQYYRQENNVFWRELDNLPPSEQLIQSPFLSTGSTKSPWLLLASQPLLLWPPPQAVPEFANSIV